MASEPRALNRPIKQNTIKNADYEVKAVIFGIKEDAKGLLEIAEITAHAGQSKQLWVTFNALLGRDFVHTVAGALTQQGIDGVIHPLRTGHHKKEVCCHSRKGGICCILKTTELDSRGHDLLGPKHSHLQHNQYTKICKTTKIQVYHGFPYLSSQKLGFDSGDKGKVIFTDSR